MKKTDRNLYILYMLFAIALVTANCIGTKVVKLPFNLFGSAVTLTAGALCYPLTFLITDIIGELWDKKKASIAVLGGFICQIVSTLIVIVSRYLPAVDGDVQNAYVVILGQSWVFVIASLSAFLVSQSWDVYVFHKIREAYIKRFHTTRRGKWIWNIVGTVTSQLVDSILYAGIAFGLGFGWLGQPESRIMLINLILAQWLVKIIIALIGCPIFHLCTKGSYKEVEASFQGTEAEN